MLRLARTALVLLATLCLVPGAARAFDTGPHADLTRDAFTAEGFGAPAADVGMVNNWFTDYYTNPDKNPHSGHANAILGVTRLGLAKENWLNQWIEGARRSHFDAEQRLPEMPDLSKTAGVEKEWDRQMYLARRWLRYAGEREDPYLVMAIAGISLHSIQDFYAHSNWVEARGTTYGKGGPGVASLGYGNTPTFFDIPPEVRKTFVGPRAVYTGVKGVPRNHGNWQSDKNRNLTHGLNKDWPGRPDYTKAYMTAYFASRQWIRALRTWLGNEPLWKRAMSLPSTAKLRHDVTGATEISQFTGHWQGGGEPCVPFSCGERTGRAGSVSSLTVALRDFHAGSTSRYRRAFNEMIGAWKEYPKNLGDQPDLPVSRADHLFTKFVKLEVTRYRGIDLGDIGSGADIYANARLRGQSYTSTIINGRDSFAFGGSYAPFTWIRSVPTDNRASEPVTSMTVRIETGGRSSAGTDDDVYLRINGRQRFSLDKGLYDDFERGDDDTYSVPIGDATRRGLTVGDIDRVTIQKSKDGHSGGWFLHGVTLKVNGRTFLRDRKVDRWLEDSRRTWNAPGFVHDHRTSDVVPAWLQLKEDDWGPQDTGDVNVYDRHTSQPVAYRPGAAVVRKVTGAARLKGRVSLSNGDKASLTYRLTTLFVTAPPLPAPSEPPVTPPPPPPPTGPPPPGPKPDLVVTGLTLSEVTVENQGPGPSGPFTVTVNGRAPRFPGLAAGASSTQTYAGSCEGAHHAVADANQEVFESDETNNTRDLTDVIC